MYAILRNGRCISDAGVGFLAVLLGSDNLGTFCLRQIRILPMGSLNDDKTEN